jgi:hypothetical protein
MTTSVATVSSAPVSGGSGQTAPTDGGRRFLDALAGQDFEQLAATLAADVRMRALLPGDTLEWDGPERVTRTFVRWFGNTEGFDLVATTLDDLGSRLHLSWCARVRAERLGEGWHRVEQQAYVDVDEHGRIEHIWLACSGYLAERDAP